MVVFFEQFVQFFQMFYCLRKLFFDLFGNIFLVGKMQGKFFGVSNIVFLGDVLEERNDVVGDVVLNSGIVFNSIYVFKRCVVQFQMCVCFKGMFVVLCFVQFCV